MGGHSHWATIKRKKGAADQKRGKLFSKLARAVTIAARNGADPDMNVRLRHAMEKARVSSVPKDIIERAVQKGSGGLEGQAFQEITYEGYGSGGVAMLVHAVTDNPHRTAPEIRKIFEKRGGKLGGTGATAWMFKRKGLIAVAKGAMEEDALMELALSAGADDLIDAGAQWEVTSDVDSYEGVRAAIEAAGLTVELSELTLIADTEADLEPHKQKVNISLMDELEEHDDVQNVYAAFTPSDDVIAELSAG
jgi:YebC/PmpR family DNA-binding regulatory protein